MGIGRPTTFDQAVADAICERIAEGEVLVSILRDEGMPPRRTLYNWLRDRPDFAAAMDRARDLGYDVIAEGTLDIADDGRNDWMEKFGRDGESVGYEVNGEHVQRSKLRVWTRMQLLAKWHPKRYGERHQLEHSGPGGGPITTAAIDTSKLNDDQLRALASIAVPSE